jgi:hypothetical protein
MYNIPMNTISTTEMRKNISSIIQMVKETRKPIGVGRRDALEVIIYPAKAVMENRQDWFSSSVYTGVFDFWLDEDDTYTIKDLKKVF